MHDPREEARRWLDQAENDLAFARHALKGEFFHQVCFISQQCSEKAVKAVHFADGARDVIGHSVVGLVDRLGRGRDALRALRDQAAELDVYYIPARYPNGLAEGTPHRVFTRSQADRALTAAESILEAVRQELE
jgi:HEPN domain-containing protein